MKIGLLAYSSNTGLGYQTRDFSKNIECEKILIADLSGLNGMPVDHSWAYQPRICDGIPTNEDMEWLSDDMDVVFVCETPLNWELFRICERKGVKTVMQYNYEFLNYFRNIKLPAPDVLASPSYWEIPAVEKLGIAPVKYLPVPIDIERFTFRENDEVNTLVHVMGRPAQNDRNGTRLYLEMAKKLGKEFIYRLFIQTPKERNTQLIFEDVKPLIDETKELLGENFEIIFDAKDNTDLYAEGEIMMMPRRYGGLCLPLWEGLASGMPVLMTDISPNNKVLPEEWVFEANENGYVETHSKIPMYEAEVDSMIEAIRKVQKDYPENNKKARELAESMSWESRKPYYLKLFMEVCQNQV